MRDINTFLPFWEGFSVVTIKPDGDALQIDLTPHAARFPSCGGCQKPCSTTHEYCERTVRDLPILGRAVRLSVLLRRVGCRPFTPLTVLDGVGRGYGRSADSADERRLDAHGCQVLFKQGAALAVADAVADEQDLDRYRWRLRASTP